VSDIAIHQLPAAGPLSGGEIVPVDDGTATVRTTVSAIRAGLATAGHGHAIADVTGLQFMLDGKAPLVSPAFTGSVGVPAGSAAAAAVAPAADPDTGLFFPAANTVGLAVGGMEAGRVAADRTVTLGAAPGAESLRVVPVANGVNRVQVRGAASGALPALEFEGSDAVVSGYYRVRNGSHYFITDGAFAPGFAVHHATGVNRHVTVTGSNGGDPTIGTSGGRLAFGAIPVLPSYTVATLPTASARGLVYVSDGAGGKRLAVSDGTGWRWPDGSTVS
jgi:hypothetical protein